MQNATIPQLTLLATAAADWAEQAFHPLEPVPRSAVPQATPLATEAACWPKQLFQPLERETRSAVPTDAAAYYLNRKPQTLRAWACLENGPIRPLRINGRLAWRVSDLNALLDGEVPA